MVKRRIPPLPRRRGPTRRRCAACRGRCPACFHRCSACRHRSGRGGRGGHRGASSRRRRASQSRRGRRRSPRTGLGRRQARASRPAGAEKSERLVYVWPHLVTIEFLAAMLLLLTIVVVSIILQAPLEAHANADKTPNPSKAPWYFLNLQELLLHMHPSLAGVLVPSAVLFGLIPLIPYFDRSTVDVGKWFGTPKAVRICIFTTVYSTIVLIALILFDERVGVKPLMQNLANLLHAPILSDVNPFGIGALSLPNVIVPTFLMLFPIFVLCVLIKVIYRPDGVRDYMFALFTGFVVAYVVLTIVGTFFRGQQMILMWPWDPRQVRLD